MSLSLLNLKPDCKSDLQSDYKPVRRHVQAGIDEYLSSPIHRQDHFLLLTRSLPAGTFGLVTAQYLHSPIAGAAEREAVFASAATAVTPGGTLLVISHAGFPTWCPNSHRTTWPSSSSPTR